MNTGGQGMKSKEWGPKGWLFLHLLAERYPDKASKKLSIKMSKMIKVLRYTLPCIYCRNNLTTHLKKVRCGATGKSSLRNFLWELHNMVNLNLDKPQQPISILSKHNTKNWSEEIFIFLFAMAYNYPPNTSLKDPQKPFKTFFDSLSQILSDKQMMLSITPEMLSLCFALITHPYKSVKDSSEMLEWLYLLYHESQANLSKHCEPYNEICNKMDKMCAKK